MKISLDLTYIINDIYVNIKKFLFYIKNLVKEHKKIKSDLVQILMMRNMSTSEYCALYYFYENGTMRMPKNSINEEVAQGLIKQGYIFMENNEYVIKKSFIKSFLKEFNKNRDTYITPEGMKRAIIERKK